MQEELLGAAYAVLEKVHIIDVRSVHETKDVPAKDSEGRRKNKVGRAQRKSSTQGDSHLLGGHLIVQGLEVLVAEVPLGHGEHIQCLEGGENATLQLQQAKRQLKKIHISINISITLYQLQGHTYKGFSLLSRSSVSTTMAIIMCIVMNCKGSQ